MNLSSEPSRRSPKATPDKSVTGPQKQDASGQSTDQTVLNIQLVQSSFVPAKWQNPNSFAIVRLQSSTGLANRITKVSSIPALLVSVALRPIAANRYKLWLEDKLVTTAFIPAFRVNVVDLSAEPSCWAAGAFDYVHYHVPREGLDEIAEDLGFARVSNYKLSIAEDDLVLSQMTKNVLPYISCS
jgi:hypothetical protein